MQISFGKNENIQATKIHMQQRSVMMLMLMMAKHTWLQLLFSFIFSFKINLCRHMCHAAISMLRMEKDRNGKITYSNYETQRMALNVCSSNPMILGQENYDLDVWLSFPCQMFTCEHAHGIFAVYFYSGYPFWIDVICMWKAFFLFHLLKL